MWWLRTTCVFACLATEQQWWDGWGTLPRRWLIFHPYSACTLAHSHASCPSPRHLTIWYTSLYRHLLAAKFPGFWKLFFSILVIRFTFLINHLLLDQHWTRISQNWRSGQFLTKPRFCSRSHKTFTIFAHLHNILSTYRWIAK